MRHQPTQVSTGGLGRNVLGCEWVLPTGEVLRMGSAEAGSGWYSADGPGFSLRGILRGHSGANGGHGVITKASVKLYPWYGPGEWQLEGTIPALKQLEKVPDGFKGFVLTFPSEENTFDALREIAQAGLCFALLQNIMGVMGEGNDELWAAMQHASPEDMRVANDLSLLMLLHAASPREMEYREKCLFKIAERWGGVLVPPLNDPKSLASRFNMMAWSMGPVREVFRATTDFYISPCADATEDSLKNLHAAAVQTIAPYIQRGVLMAALASFHVPYENASTGSHIESLYFYDPFDQKSLEGTRELIGETFDAHGKFNKFGVPCLGGGLQIEPVSHVNQNWGPVYDNYHVWLAKIKDALDPNNIGDWSAYVPPVFP
jgi:glycolate oxidase